MKMHHWFNSTCSNSVTSRTVKLSSIVTVEPELVIVLPVKDNSPSVCAPDPLAVKLPEIVTLGVNAVVIVSVADTVCVI